MPSPLPIAVQLYSFRDDTRPGADAFTLDAGCSTSSPGSGTAAWRPSACRAVTSQRHERRSRPLGSR